MRCGACSPPRPTASRNRRRGVSSFASYGIGSHRCVASCTTVTSLDFPFRHACLYFQPSLRPALYLLLLFIRLTRFAHIHTLSRSLTVFRSSSNLRRYLQCGLSLRSSLSRRSSLPTPFLRQCLAAFPQLSHRLSLLLRDVHPTTTAHFCFRQSMRPSTTNAHW